MTATRFALEIVPALREAAVASLACAKLQVRVCELYAEANAVGISAVCPEGFAGATRDKLTCIARQLLAIGIIELSDPILHGIDLG